MKSFACQTRPYMAKLCLPYQSHLSLWTICSIQAKPFYTSIDFPPHPQCHNFLFLECLLDMMNIASIIKLAFKVLSLRWLFWSPLHHQTIGSQIFLYVRTMWKFQSSGCETQVSVLSEVPRILGQDAFKYSPISSWSYFIFLLLLLIA